MLRAIALLTTLSLLLGAGYARASEFRLRPELGRTPAAVAPTAVYTGRTAQGRTVRLAREIGGRRWFRYQATMTCNDGSTFTDDPFSDDVTIRGDHFSDHDSADGGAITTTVTGTLAGRRASGTVRIIERFSEDAVNGTTPLAADGAIVCDSRTVAWHATA